MWFDCGCTVSFINQLKSKLKAKTGFAAFDSLQYTVYCHGFSFWFSCFLFYFVVISSCVFLSHSASRSCVSNIPFSFSSLISCLVSASLALPCSQCFSTCTSSTNKFSLYLRLCCSLTLYRFVCSVSPYQSCVPCIPVFLPVFFWFL